MGNETHQPLQSLLELLRRRYGQEGVVEDGGEGQPEGPEGVQQQGEREDLPEGLGAVDHLDVLEKRIFINMFYFNFFSFRDFFATVKRFFFGSQCSDNISRNCGGEESLQ